VIVDLHAEEVLPVVGNHAIDARLVDYVGIEPAEERGCAIRALDERRHRELVRELWFNQITVI
jgi:hypothetical protein